MPSVRTKAEACLQGSYVQNAALPADAASDALAGTGGATLIADKMLERGSKARDTYHANHCPESAF